jgi:hypothetical protein
MKSEVKVQETAARLGIKAPPGYKVHTVRFPDEKKPRYALIPEEDPEPGILSMRHLLRIKREASRGCLKLKVTIPAKVVPLFKTLVEITGADSAEAFAAWAICKGCTSEEAMSQFDDLVNELL